MMPKKSAAKNNTNPFSEFVLFTNGGESVSFACASSPAHNLFFKFVLFPTITFVRLIRFASQTCAPCAFKNAQVCDPTLSAKIKEARLGLLWLWV